MSCLTLNKSCSESHTCEAILHLNSRPSRCNEPADCYMQLADDGGYKKTVAVCRKHRPVAIYRQECIST